MGVNNLLRYLKDAAIDVQMDNLPKEYNLSIDLATIVVPIMQVSTNRHDFVARLRAYIMDNQRLVALLLHACEVRIYLDMFAPRMKMTTLSHRQRERGLKISRRHHIADEITKKSSPYHEPPLNINPNDREVKSIVQLREVRNTITSTILHAMGEFDENFESRCYFDIYRIGEGEIKCMSSSQCCPNLPNVILSNDNDVLLMILLHEPDKNIQHGDDLYKIPHYYRAMIYHNKMKTTPGNEIIFHRFSADAMASCQPASPPISPSARCRWILVVWIICLCGTDFVSPVCTITQHCRTMLLRRCVIRFKRDSHSTALCRHFNFDNFFIIMNILFDILADNEKQGDVANYPISKQPVRVDNAPQTLSRYTTERLDKVAIWCSRVYWNILYFIDLPVDFHLRGSQMFKSDRQVAVNACIKNESVSFCKLLNLTLIHRHYLYERIKSVCMLSANPC